MLPAQSLAHQCDFFSTQWRAVTLFFALFVGRTKTDHGFAADDGGLVGLGASGFDGGLDGGAVVTVNGGDDMPAVGFKTLGGVVGEPTFYFTVDGNAIVVVERNQLAQTQSARQGASFVGDTFHQAAIAHKGVSVVIDDIVVIAVELVGQNLLGQCHTHGVGDALTQRAGGGLNARRVAVLRVARSLGVHLTEVFQLFDGQIVAAQVQQRVDQHGAVAVGQDKAVAVSPVGVGRIVL